MVVVAVANELVVASVEASCLTCSNDALSETQVHKKKEESKEQEKKEGVQILGRGARTEREKWNGIRKGRSSHYNLLLSPQKRRGPLCLALATRSRSILDA